MKVHCIGCQQLVSVLFVTVLIRLFFVLIIFFITCLHSFYIFLMNSTQYYIYSVKWLWNDLKCLHLSYIYYGEFAMYSWGCSSPIISCTFSKCGIWECSHVGKTDKESKHFVLCHTHFLTRLQTHHTHILSYQFWFGCYRFDRLRVSATCFSAVCDSLN